MKKKNLTVLSGGKPAIIFAKGSLPRFQLIQRYLKNAGIIICADGGADALVHTAIRPDVIIGDLDSITPETLQHFKLSAIQYLPSQEITDLQKALEYVEHLEIKQAIIFGATGGIRIDHLLGNIALIELFKNRIDIEMVDEWCSIKLVHKQITVTGIPGQIISLWSFSDKTTGIVTTGLRYPLHNETMVRGTHGISNEFETNTASISVQKGDLMVIVQHPELLSKKER
jgi:thiamine pyrophosphokinase